MHEGRCVDELDPHGEVEDVVGVRGPEARGEDDQCRTEALATRLDDVRHRARHRAEVGCDLRVEPALELLEFRGDGLEQLVGGDAHDPAASRITGRTGRTRRGSGNGSSKRRDALVANRCGSAVTMTSRDAAPIPVGCGSAAR